MNHFLIYLMNIEKMNNDIYKNNKCLTASSFEEEFAVIFMLSYNDIGINNEKELISEDKIYHYIGDFGTWHECWRLRK